VAKGCPGSRSVSGAMRAASWPLPARSHRAAHSRLTAEFVSHGVGDEPAAISDLFADSSATASADMRPLLEMTPEPDPLLRDHPGMDVAWSEAFGSLWDLFAKVDATLRDSAETADFTRLRCQPQLSYGWLEYSCLIG